MSLIIKRLFDQLIWHKFRIMWKMIISYGLYWEHYSLGCHGFHCRSAQMVRLTLLSLQKTVINGINKKRVFNSLLLTKRHKHHKTPQKIFFELWLGKPLSTRLWPLNDCYKYSNLNKDSPVTSRYPTWLFIGIVFIWHIYPE